MLFHTVYETKKNLYRKLTSSKVISNFKTVRKPVTYKCSDKI